MAEEIIIKIDVRSEDAKKGLDNVSKATDGAKKSTDKLANAKKELNFQLSKEGKELAKIKKAIADQTALNKKNASSTIQQAKGVSELTKLKRKLAALQTDEAVQLAKVNEQIKIQREVNVNLAKSELGLASAKTQSARAAKQFRTQAGLQNAILLETGRLASDVGFGFTAIANNLSQLISLGTSFINTTGSLGQSMKELGRSLMGTGGVILLIQLFIGALQSREVQKFIGELFRLKGAFAELRDLTEAYGNKIGELTGKFRLYTDILDDSNRSEEEKQIALRKINKEYPEYNANIETEKNNLNDVNKERRNYIKLLQEQALSQAAQEKLLEIASEFGTEVLEKRIRLLELETEITKQQNTIQSLLNKENITETEKANLRQAVQLKNLAESSAKVLEDETKQVTEEYDKRRKIITEFVKLTDDEDKNDKDRRVRRFKQQFIDLTKTILDYNKRASKINSVSAQEQLDIDEQFAVKEANRRKDQFVERQAQRLEEYKEQVKGRKDADKLIADAEAEYRESTEDAEVQHKKLLLTIEEAYITERILLKQKEALEVAKLERKIENTVIKSTRSQIGANELYYNTKLEQIATDIRTQSEALGTTQMTAKEEAQARLDLSNLLIQQSRLEAESEVANAREKQRVNQEYLGFIKGMSSVFRAIAGENEAAQNAALVVEKGAAIADVVINATAANAAARAQLTAQAANPIALAALTPIVESQIARNNIGAGIAITNILATTLSSFKRPTESAIDTIPVSAPAFNVVGPSTTDQLLQGVQGSIGDIRVNLNLNEVNDGIDTLNVLQETSEVTS